MSMTSTTDGTSIAYAVTGSGPAIVLHPGVSLPGASFPEALTAPLVEAGHTVVTVDPRDTGASTRFDGTAIDLGAIMGGDHSSVPYTFGDMAEDVVAVLDAIEAPSATLVGHSMGGSVVAAVQAAAPDRVDGLVYMSCAPGLPRVTPPDFLAILLRDPPTDREVAVTWRSDLSRWSLGAHSDEAIIRERAEWMVDELGWWGIPTTHIAASIVDLPDMASITTDEASTALIYGDEDALATAGARTLAEAMPDATVLELEGFGHWFPEPGPWPEIAATILTVAGDS